MTSGRTRSPRPSSVRRAPTLRALTAIIGSALIAATVAQTGAQRLFEGAAPAFGTSYDIRLDKSAQAAQAYWARGIAGGVFAAGRDQRFAARADSIARLQADESVDTSINPELRTLEIVSARPGRGFLTGPSSDRVAALRGFLARHSAAFGLSQQEIDDLAVVADYDNPGGNMRWVELEQRMNDIPVFRGYVRGGFTAAGELARITGQLAPDMDATAGPALPSTTAAEAVSRAAAHVGRQVSPDTLAVRLVEAGGRRVTLSRASMASDVRAWQVYFPLVPGIARLAWATEIWGDADAFLIVVDAEDGTVLFRKNLTDYQTQSAAYVVYHNDSPAPSSPTPALPGDNYQAPYILRSTYTLVGNEGPNTFNNLGWMTDGLNETQGNNVIAGLDRAAPNGIDATVAGTSRVFDFSYNPEADDPLTTNYQRGGVTNMFYWANRFHDATYQLGFTEAARNFQNDNFGRGGLGGDRVNAEGQDFSGTNNANFTTVSDGGIGRMQMYLWTGPTPDRSGDVDNDIVLHELTHGLSNRLHANAAGLSSNMSRGLGEGWSDFYARSLLAQPDEDVAGVYAVGGWATHLGTSGYTSNYYYGIRRFPYAVKATVGGPSNLPHNPLTFADVDSTQINLSDGAFPRGPFGSATADAVHNLGEVWAMALFEVRARFIARLGFATGNRRILQLVTDGMKLDPISPTFLQARDSIIAAANASGTADDVADIWAGFAARGMGVLAQVINDGGTNGLGATRVVENFNVPGEAVPTLSIDDISFAEGNTGTRTATFTVTLVNPSTASSSVSYSTADGTAVGAHVHTNGTTISIPNGAPTTTIGPAGPYPASIAVSGLTGTLQHLSVRLNSLSHSWPEDMDLLLVGPGGEKAILVSDVGTGSGISGVNLTIEDGAPALTSAPILAGRYAPTDLESGDVFPSPAPAGPYGAALSVFNGTNPNGTWSLYANDDTSGDSGSLASFSLVITSGSSDYVPASGVLTFSPGTTVRTLDVPINGDTDLEPDESFTVTVSNAVNAFIADATGVGSIIDDDAAVPTSVDDSYSTPFNTPLAVAAPGVLANDTSNGGGTTSAIFDSGPSSGTLMLNANGSFTYTPAAAFVGAATFTYRARNAVGNGNVATVSITVSPPPAPTAVDDGYATPFNTPLAVPAPGVLANDSSNGGGSMTAAIVTPATHGNLVLNTTGDFTYTPAAGFTGTDTFTYRASNAGGPGNVATVTITVAEPTTPQSPAGLYVSSVVGNLVTLRWTPSSVGPEADGFVVEGGLGPGDALGSLPTNSASPVFSFVAPTGSFYARVHQLSGGNRSPASNEIRVHVNVPVPPSPPADLLSSVDGNSLAVSWRNTFGGGPPASLILDVTGSASASLSFGAIERASFAGVPGGTYTLSVRAINAGGTSAPSNAVTVSVPASCAGAPLSPVSFLFYKAGGVAHVIWEPATTGPAASHYVVNVTGPFSVNLPTTVRQVSGVPPPGTYSASVTAVNSCGASAPTPAQVLVFP